MDLIWLKDVFFLIISRKKVDLLYGNVNVYIAEQKKIITGNNLRFEKYSHFCRVCGNGKE